MSAYRHTQVGRLILGVFAVAAGVLATVSALAHSLLPALAGAVAITAAGALFGTLTVEVDDRAVRVRFGPGLVRRTLPLASIRDARAVRNRWWYGWGLRLTPHGWIYSVSGLDAVELLLEDGRKVRIGTDEPRSLERAVRSAAGL